MSGTGHATELPPGWPATSGATEEAEAAEGEEDAGEGGSEGGAGGQGKEEEGAEGEADADAIEGADEAALAHDVGMEVELTGLVMWGRAGGSGV